MGKIFWAAVLLAGLLALIASGNFLASTFAGAQTQVTVRVVTPEGLNLPEVTVCSMGRLNKTLADEAGLNATALVDYLYGSFASLVGFGFSEREVSYFQRNLDSVDTKRRFYKALDNWKLANPTSPDVSDLLQHLTQKCVSEEETFSCMLAGRVIDDCCGKVQVFNNYNGPCFRFPMLQSFLQTVGGIRKGFTALYQPPREDVYVKSDFNVFKTRGLQLFFYPFAAGIELDPILLQEGWEYSVALTGREIQMLNTKVSKCNTETIDMTGHGYVIQDTYSLCMYNCLTAEFAKTCGCKPINSLYARNGSTVEFCNPDVLVDCVIRNQHEIKVKAPDRCTHSCPYDCKYFEREATVTTTALVTSPPHTRNLPTNNSRAIRFSVYYSFIQYTEFREIETANAFQLISNIGGVFGLWTGASVVSILHVVQQMIRRVSTRNANKKRQRQREDEAKRTKRRLRKIAKNHLVSVSAAAPQRISTSK